MIPYVFAPSTVVKSAEVNKNFEVISHSGLIMHYGGSTAPEGWLICDGSAVSRTTYASLFAVIGTTYGAGDGSTTFNIPNVKGRSIVGYDTSQTEFDTIGETGGAKTHTLTTAQLPNIAGSLVFHGAGSATVLAGISGVFTGTARSSYRTGGSNTGGANSYDGASFSVGSGQAHNNLSPYIVFPCIIKT